MASLSKSLEEYKSTFDSNTPVEILETINRSISLLQEHANLRNCLQINTPFPPFALPDINQHIVESKQLLTSGPLIITFIRGGWCPYCVLEIRAWQEQFEQSKRKLNIIAITPEKPLFAKSMQAENHLEFPLLFDPELCFAEQLGLLWQLNNEMKQALLKWNIDLTERNSDQTFNLPIPATFVIDQNGLIKYRFIEEDYSLRAEPDEVLATYHGLKGQ